jgi:ABC-type Fe3+ transport system permease subunit
VALLVVVILAPGLAIVALLACIVLAVCAVTVAAERLTNRRPAARTSRRGGHRRQPKQADGRRNARM